VNWSSLRIEIGRIDWNIVVSVLSLTAGILAILLAYYFQRKNEKNDKEHILESSNQAVMLAALSEQNALLSQEISSKVITEDLRDSLETSIELLNTTIEKAQGMIRPENQMTKSERADFSKRIKDQLGEKEGAKKIKHLEAEAWEDFLNMAIGQASLWANRPEGKWHMEFKQAQDRNHKNK
jgi:hypothetical protein